MAAAGRKRATATGPTFDTTITIRVEARGEDPRVACRGFSLPFRPRKGTKFVLPDASHAVQITSVFCILADPVRFDAYAEARLTPRQFYNMLADLKAGGWHVTAIDEVPA